jgi:hypothetical protein
MSATQQPEARAEAQRSSGLPFVASLVRDHYRDAAETFSGTADVCGVAIHLAGVAIERDGESITGSAASLDADPSSRAWMELAERFAVLDALRANAPRIVLRDAVGRSIGVVKRSRVYPSNAAAGTLRFARSNGVAAGIRWSDAARRARFELVERDRVLRSWYGEVLPKRVPLPSASIPAGLFTEYEFSAFSFDEPGFGDDVSVVGVFGFPRQGAPMVYGFGARETGRAALECAAAECVQRIGFLFSEPLPEVAPALSPTADFHQDHFLFPPHQARLRDWLGGHHRVFRGLLVATVLAREPVYVDLTPAQFGGRCVVVKAVPRGHVPLAFGIGHPWIHRPVPVALAVHPIA